jgi:hypothetical protein
MPDQHRAFYEQLPFMLYGASVTGVHGQCARRRARVCPFA